MRTIPSILALAAILMLATGVVTATTGDRDTAPERLADQLAERAKASATRLDPATQALFAEEEAKLEASGLAQAALTVGQQAPRFTLPNATGEAVALADALTEGPVVLTFYRGGWCPYCNIQLAAYQQHLNAFRAAGATLIAISPEAPSHAEATAAKHDLTFPVLSDKNNQVARAFGIVFTLSEQLDAKYQTFGLDVAATNETEAAELPLAATYVIDRDGTIRWAFVESDYKLRAEPADVIAAVRDL